MTSPRGRPGVALLVAVAATLGVGGRARAGTAFGPSSVESVPPAAPAAPAEPAAQADDVEPQGPRRGERHTEFFPLPLYATSPAEGATYGVLPVFMRVDALGNTKWILAPSASFNSATKVNGTFRYYSFPTLTRQWWIILAGSTHVNRSARFELRDVPGYPKSHTLEVQLIARKSLFYRFFGFGPDTLHSGQSSYTRIIALASVRAGLNLFPHVNLGVRGGFRWDKPEVGAVFGLPPTQVLYPGTPGLDGAALATAELSLRFDSREVGDYSDQGLASELHAARDFGVSRSESFYRLTWHTRLLVRETSFLGGAAHAYWTQEFGDQAVPFYYRSSLGGDTLFRGFTDDRFIDRGAWEAEIEQRLRVLRTDWFHVNVDWRVDPFVGIGQVYPQVSEITSHVRKVLGVGLRAFVHPNVLGRVDVAWSSDGITAYVILGYPY